MSNYLASFTDDQLLEELVRRRNAKKLERVPPRWCDECLHFKTWDKENDPPKSYNPCLMGHAMEFYTPRSWQSPETFGHYRIICTDRTECPQ